MNDELRTETGPGADDEVRILDLLAVLIRRWRFIFGTTGIALLIGLAAVLLWPGKYSAETVLVPASSNSSGVGAQLLSSQLPPGLAVLAGGPPGDQKLIGAILKSRILTDSMVARLGYEPHAGSPEESEVRRVLARATSTQTNADGSVVIRVRDTDPERAARIANTFPLIINGIMSSVFADASRQRQTFLDAQLAIAHEQLQQAEQRLLAFQQAQDAPQIQEQTRRTLDAAATLQQRIIEQEIVVAQLRRTLTPDHPELRAAIFELDARTAQLTRLTRGSGLESEFFRSFGESAELGVAFTRLLRDYTRNEQIYLSLTRALAESQIDANNSTPILSVLDPALVPRQPLGLPRAVVISLALVLGVITGIAGAFGREFFLVARRDPANQEFFRALDQVRSDIRVLLRLGRTDVVTKVSRVGDMA